jgi:DNA-directed RNA polymerase subunit N (RpoN/RPB10)
MTAKEMKNEFTSLISDVFDNYHKYTDDEREEIANILSNLDKLNTILDKYDCKRKRLSVKSFYDSIRKGFSK